MLGCLPMPRPVPNVAAAELLSLSRPWALLRLERSNVITSAGANSSAAAASGNHTVDGGGLLLRAEEGAAMRKRRDPDAVMWQVGL